MLDPRSTNWVRDDRFIGAKMNLYAIISVIITLAILVSYCNYRFLKMQPAIAIMVTSLFLSIVLLISDRLGFHVVHHDVTAFVNQLHFHDLLNNYKLEK